MATSGILLGQNNSNTSISSNFGSFLQNDLYMYIMQTHPILFASPYKDAWKFDITNNHQPTARTISLSGNAESITV